MSSTSNNLPPGTILGKGRYKVIRELNRGGTAVVYEGLDLTAHNTVALKVMSIKDGKSSVPIKGVRREIEYAASIQHENVVKLIDFVADDQQIVIVWELIQGSDLLDLLNERGGKLEEFQAAIYFAQLLQAVDFIHAHGLCHRDLKPENCMVERGTDRLKIIDFGLSKHQQSAVTLGVGTPDYMAPELLGNATGGFSSLQERKVGHYDAKACDVWAMGVLLYLLVSGQYPFEDPHQPQNVVATLQNIAHGRMRPLPRRTSPECIHLINSMLTQSPLQRISLHDIIKHPWLKKHIDVSNLRFHSEEKQNYDNEERRPRSESFSFNNAASSSPNSKIGGIATKPTPTVALPAMASSSSPLATSDVREIQSNTIANDNHGTTRRNRLVPPNFCKMWFGS